ncbi:MAG: DUF1848 domain-containing protein [Bacilli bacterium]|nr:DUF1848 domain-containing protein [Bacilli bacterium]
MILFASGRTDIPAFYSRWFMNRYAEGYVDSRNPFYLRMVSRIYFSDVDAIMFCSKNPTPILDELPKIDKPIVFHVTITPYRKDIEPRLYDKREVLDAVKRLSTMLSPRYVVVRYDPIFLSDVYDVDYHLRAFRKLTQELRGYINTVIVSFIDDCKSVRRNQAILNSRPFEEEDYRRLGEGFSALASEAGMVVQTCYEQRNLFEYGFYNGECFPVSLAYELTGKKFKANMPRKGGACHCVGMADIGDYNCCPHGCKYCYANYDEKNVFENMKKHDPNSSLLIGHVSADDIIKVRKP